MLKKILTMLTLSSFTLLTSCGRIEVKNTEWWVDKKTKATSFNTLFDGSRSLTGAAWDDYRFGMVCGKPEAFAELKKEIEQACNLSDKCDYEQVQKKLDQVMATIQRIRKTK